MDFRDFEEGMRPRRQALGLRFKVKEILQRKAG
jgi:hypothetical protein